MNRRTPLLLLVVVLAACSGSTPGQTTPPPAQSPPATQEVPTVAPATPAPLPSPAVAPLCQAGPEETWVQIDSHANLFGAGLDAAPAPGGGGGGVVPPVIELPADGDLTVTFPCTAGVTDCCGSPPTIGPAGFVGSQSTLVESAGGISGMVMQGRVMFLAGVFLSDSPPAEPAPERLDFTDDAEFKRLKPELGQTFFIGDGAGKRFIAPAGATRLYLGFVDAYVFQGEPGWYGNNTGYLEATVRVAAD